MQKVEVNQVWSVLGTYQHRIEFTVTRIVELNGEVRAFGTVKGGRKEASFTVHTLSKGLRAARLLRHADGHEAYTIKERKEAVAPSASRSRIVPRGIATVTPRMEEAFAMRGAGMTRREIATYYKVSEAMVSKWCGAVRDKLQDDRNRRLLEECGR
jgi:DNA-binding CsgD family transcriptional regulator